MKTKYIYQSKITLCLLPVLILFFISGCSEDLLNKQPLDALSVGTFWQTENDAKLALTGVYNSNKNAEEGRNFYGYSLLTLDAATDNGCFAGHGRESRFTDGRLVPTWNRNQWHYERSYIRIAAANNFLENIDAVEMDAAKKKEMIAEVRFLRAYQYFWLCQFYGGVPLVEKVLTVDEANTLTRNTKAEIVNFVEDELTAAATDLPPARPAEEDGRIVKAAALAMKGRLLMAEKRWAEAATIYSDIMGMDIYELDPRYKELFEDGGKGSKEVIYSVKYMENVQGTTTNRSYKPQQYGGWSKLDPYNDLVRAFDMTDGQPEDQSPLFNPSNPYINKDPRLYATVFVPGMEFQGSIYQPHPDSVPSYADFSGIRYGYNLKKYVDEYYTGDITNYGADFVVIRYAEILLSYLESEFEANGGVATQQLLDETVNLVRARAEVNMPPIMLPDFSRDRMRNERRVETAWEGIRLFDIMRWEIAHIVCTGDVTSIKLTDDPENSAYNVDKDGFFIIYAKAFNYPTNYLWPIPQTEIDINPLLEQNPGY